MVTGCDATIGKLSCVLKRGHTGAHQDESGCMNWPNPRPLMERVADDDPLKQSQGFFVTVDAEDD